VKDLWHPPSVCDRRRQRSNVERRRDGRADGSRPASTSARRNTNSIWALVLRKSSPAHRANALCTSGSRRSSTAFRRIGSTVAVSATPLISTGNRHSPPVADRGRWRHSSSPTSGSRFDASDGRGDCARSSSRPAPDSAVRGLERFSANSAVSLTGFQVAIARLLQMRTLARLMSPAHARRSAARRLMLMAVGDERAEGNPDS
jgi:hypothetical protein